jgi:hypothetical protein
MTSPRARVAVLLAVLLVALAGTGGATLALLGDSETLEANVTTALESEREADARTLSIQSTGDGSLVVGTHNDRDEDDWTDGIDVGPSGHNTTILVIVGHDEVKLDVESDADEPLRFEIDTSLLLSALDAQEFSQLEATLDGEYLRLHESRDVTWFEIDHFSTRYVVITAAELPPEPSDDTSGTDGANGNGNDGATGTDGGDGTGETVTDTQSSDDSPSDTQSTDSGTDTGTSPPDGSS